MIHSNAEVYAETGKRELWVISGQGSDPGKKNNADVKICKHLEPGGWCSKKNQRCPLLNPFTNQ